MDRLLPLLRAPLTLPFALNAAAVVAGVSDAPLLAAGCAAVSGGAMLWNRRAAESRPRQPDVPAGICPDLSYLPWLNARDGGIAAVDVLAGDGDNGGGAVSIAAIVDRALAETAGWRSLLLSLPLTRAQLCDTQAMTDWLAGLDQAAADRLCLRVPEQAMAMDSECGPMLKALRRAGISLLYPGSGGAGGNVLLHGGASQEALNHAVAEVHRSGGRAFVGDVANVAQERAALWSGCDFVSGSYYFAPLAPDELLAMSPLGTRTTVHGAGKRSAFPAPAISSSDRRLLADLMRGFDNGEVSLHYQPKMKCRTREIDSAEALIRWHHPVRGAVGPIEFIPLAERSGHILDLTWWTLERAADDQKAMKDQGVTLDISINISAGLISDPGFIREAIRRLERRSGRLAFEITETAIIDDPDAALSGLAKLVEAGIDLSIDDYGAGMSSLTYLKRVPAKELKIDRLFSAELTKSHNDPMLMRSSIDLAHGLGMEVTAEGIENQAALALLSVMGCDRVQGYLTGRPMPLADFTSFVREHKHLNALERAPIGFRPAANFW